MSIDFNDKYNCKICFYNKKDVKNNCKCCNFKCCKKCWLMYILSKNHLQIEIELLENDLEILCYIFKNIECPVCKTLSDIYPYIRTRSFTFLENKIIFNNSLNELINIVIDISNIENINNENIKNFKNIIVFKITEMINENYEYIDEEMILKVKQNINILL